MKDSSRGGWYGAFSVFAGCILLGIAHSNRLTFPSPWNDEARFYLPALWWTEHRSLQPVILNAPRGIFWVPDGFTVFIGLALRLFGRTIGVARSTCEFTVATGVAVFSVVFRKLAGSWQMGALATMLLLTPPVAFAANMVRMEAPIFLLIAVVLLLHVNGHLLAATSILFGSLLIHPALGLAAVGYSVTVWIFPRRTSDKRVTGVLDWAVLMFVAVGLFAEAARVLKNISLFRSHMAYQATRKLSTPLYSKILSPKGAILLIIVAVIAKLLLSQRAPEAGPLVAVALGVLIYSVLGHEPQYDVYCYSVAPTIVYCLMCKGYLSEPDVRACVIDCVIPFDKGEALLPERS